MTVETNDEDKKIMILRLKEAVFVASNVLCPGNPGRAAHLFNHLFNHFPSKEWKVEDYDIHKYLYATAMNMVRKVDGLTKKIYYLENNKGGE